MKIIIKILIIKILLTIIIITLIHLPLDVVPSPYCWISRPLNTLSINLKGAYRNKIIGYKWKYKANKRRKTMKREKMGIIMTYRILIRERIKIYEY